MIIRRLLCLLFGWTGLTPYIVFYKPNILEYDGCINVCKHCGEVKR